MVKLKKLSLRQSSTLLRINKQGQNMIWGGGTTFPSITTLPNPFTCAPDGTRVTRPFVTSTISPGR